MWQSSVDDSGHLETILGPSQGYLQAILGPSSGHLGASLDHLGAIFGPPWAILGQLGPIWGPSRGHLGSSLRLLGDMLGHFGQSWGHLGGHLGGLDGQPCRSWGSLRASGRLHGGLERPFQDIIGFILGVQARDRPGELGGKCSKWRILVDVDEKTGLLKLAGKSREC